MKPLLCVLCVLFFVGKTFESFANPQRLRESTQRESQARSLRNFANSLPDVAPGLADAFVSVAIDWQTDRVRAELLTIMAWAESRFDPNARPACGVMQVYPKDIGADEKYCQLFRDDLIAGVQAGIYEIELMLDDGRVRGSLRKALLYRACGNAAFEPDGCSPAKRYWVNAILASIPQRGKPAGKPHT